MRRFIASDRGSIPAVLLTSIIIGGLIVVLVAVVLVNQRTTRFDRSFTTVLQESDEYAQQAAHHIIRGDWDSSRSDPVGKTYQIAGATTCPPVADDDICMTATKTTSQRWEIEAEAAERTTGTEVATRRVSIDVVDRPRFFLAAFADTSAQLRGSNAASSYGNGVVDSGNGIIGSNGDITLNGAVTDVDGVQLYNWAAYDSFNRCTHSGGTDCDDVKRTPTAKKPSARIDERLVAGGTRLSMGFVDAKIAQCEAAAGVAGLPSYTSSVNGSVLSASSFPSGCVENLTFDTNVTISPASGPIEVYVSGLFSTANQKQINCSPTPTTPVTQCTQASDPDSTRLQIFSSGGDVVLGNQGNIAAGIYAPRSTCRGNPSNAQSGIFGSMICATISNQGGWEFNYDDKLETIGSGVFVMDDYREE